MSDPSLDFLSELDAELTKLTAAAREASRVEALRKQSNNTRLPRVDREMAKEEYLRLKELTEAFLWTSKASVALFSRQSCDGCGSVHHLFLQFMERQVWHKLPHTVRFVRKSKPGPDLPREVLFQDHTTHSCSDCCSEHGFDLSTAKSLKLETSITVSPSYIQDDLNGSFEED